MDWQELVAFTIVAMTAAIMVYKFKNKRRHSCNCCQNNGKRSGSIVYSVKKGENPKIYKPLTSIEKFIPKTFIVLYGLFTIYLFVIFVIEIKVIKVV